MYYSTLSNYADQGFRIARTNTVASLEALLESDGEMMLYLDDRNVEYDTDQDDITVSQELRQMTTLVYMNEVKQRFQNELAETLAGIENIGEGNE